MEQTGFEWENCKENVKPIREGRSVTKIVDSLKSTDYNSTLCEERREFEIELRTYAGEDPLDVWSRYIKWTERSFWKDGKDSLMFELVEKCVRRFNESEVYSDDARLLDIWIHFVTYCKEPLSVFKYLYRRRFFLKLSKFYIFWAAYTEQLNLSSSAPKHIDSIFTKGIENKAEPLDHLQSHHHQYLLRSVKKSCSTEESGCSSHVDMDIDSTSILLQPGHCDSRTAFTSLRGSSVHDRHAPSNRTAQTRGLPIVMKSSTSGANTALQMTLQGNVRAAKFAVPSDDPATLTYRNVEPALAAEECRVPRTLTSENDRENQMAPRKWNNAKIKSKLNPRKPDSMPIYATPSKPSFKIFNDDSESTPIQKPKASETKKTLLSLRKQNPSVKEDIFESLLNAKSEDTGPKFSFEYDLLYDGLEEFCFEEIAAAKKFMLHKDDHKLLTKIKNCSLTEKQI